MEILSLICNSNILKQFILSLIELSSLKERISHLHGLNRFLCTISTFHVCSRRMCI